MACRKIEKGSIQGVLIAFQTSGRICRKAITRRHGSFFEGSGGRYNMIGPYRFCPKQCGYLFATKAQRYNNRYPADGNSPCDGRALQPWRQAKICLCVLDGTFVNDDNVFVTSMSCKCGLIRYERFRRVGNVNVVVSPTCLLEIRQMSLSI